MVVFEFDLLEDFPHLERINPYDENGKKYFVLYLDNIDCFCFGKTFACLLVPDDNSEFANYSRKFINKSEKTRKCFSVPANCLKFKPDLFKKASVAGSGLVVKNTSQVKEIDKHSDKRLTFKVIKSIKSGLDRETLTPNYTDVKLGEPYVYVLEIEPLDLGVEALPPIARIVFFLSVHQDPITGKRSMMNFREKYEKLVSGLAEKELTIEVKKWCFSKQNGYYDALEFSDDNDFGRMEIGDQSISQVLANAKKTIQQVLAKHNLKISDLDGKFADWEEQMKKLDSKDKIKEFQQKLEQEIEDKQQKSENNINNGLSLPAKLAIGAGIVLVVLGLVGVVWMRKKKN